ncbi:MAG: trigger factor [Proteobacteria bacterium]|nr:trigger factor [Pseudomonadota bacterium]
MQVVEDSNEGLKREFTITVAAADIEATLNSRLKELSRTIKMPGFRPGKVPMPLLKKQYGKSLMGEILDHVVSDSSQRALADKGLRLAVQPKIEIKSFAEGADLEYTMAVELMPEIEPVEFSKLELERLVVEVSDAEIDEAIGDLAKDQAGFETVEEARPSTESDALMIDFVGRVDGEAFEGGTATDFLLELSATTFVPGFVEQIRGAKAGDHLTIKVRFPDEYGNAELAGKDAEFEVDVKELRQRGAATVDDQLAEKMGVENLNALKKAIREAREREYAAMSRLHLKRRLLDALAERCDFPVPESTANSEFEAIWKSVAEELERNKDALEEAGKSEDDLRAEYRAIAERRVRLGIFLSEVGRMNNIDVTQEDLNRAVAAEARSYPGQERKVIDHYQKDREAMGSLRAPIFEDKVVNFILELARVTERKVSLEDMLKATNEDEASPDAEADAGKEKAAAEKKAGAKEKAAAKSESGGESAPKAPSKKSAAATKKTK